MTIFATLPHKSPQNRRVYGEYENLVKLEQQRFGNISLINSYNEHYLSGN